MWSFVLPWRANSVTDGRIPTGGMLAGAVWLAGFILLGIMYTLYYPHGYV
jgi:hypothetical protein